MFTKRELLIIAASMVLTLGMVGAVGALVPILGTATFRWDEVEVDTTQAGFSRQYFSAATSTLLRLEMRAEILLPGRSAHPPRPYEQTAEQLLVVKEGTLEIEFKDVRETTAGGIVDPVQRLKPGAVVFLGPNQWHEIRNPGEQPVTYYTIEWISPGMMSGRSRDELRD